MVRPSKHKTTLVAAFITSARRVPGVDHMTRVLRRLPVGAKDQARKKALLKDLAAIEGQLRTSRRRIRMVADRVERLT
jgi:hypothetical protein